MTGARKRLANARPRIAHREQPLSEFARLGVSWVRFRSGPCATRHSRRAFCVYIMEFTTKPTRGFELYVSNGGCICIKNADEYAGEPVALTIREAQTLAEQLPRIIEYAIELITE